MYQKIQESWKALSAGILAVAAMIVGFNADQTVDLNEWGMVATAVGTFVVAAVGVWFVKNKKPLPPPPPPPPVAPPQAP